MPASPDPTDPNRCYNTAVSPSTYWREELFRIDQILRDKVKVSFRYIHDSWDTTVLTPQWGVVLRDTFPTVQNRFFGPGTSLVARLTHTISPTLLNDLVLSYVNSSITLTDENGPGRRPVSAQSHSGSAAGYRPVGSGTMQSRAQRRPGHGLPAMRDRLHFQ